MALALQCTHNRSQVRIRLFKQAPPLPAKNNESRCAMLIKLRTAEELRLEIHQFFHRGCAASRLTGLSEEPVTQSSTSHNNFRLLVVCDPVAQTSCLVTFILHSNDRPRGAEQNVAVSPQPSSATKFLAQKDVSRVKVCGNVLRFCVAPAEVQAWLLRTLSTLGGPKSTQLLHVICARCLRSQTWQTREWIRRPHGIIVVCVRPMRQEVVIPTRSKTVCASIWKEKSSRSS